MPFSIGIDARKAQDFGIGTYIRHLVEGLGEIDEENRYVLFVGPESRQVFTELPPNFELIDETSPVYSMREQVALAWKLLRLDLDLYHATHYVLPAWVPCRAVVTIHDIIHLLYPQFLPSPLAFLYAQRMIHRSLARGDAIITVSASSRTDLMEYFDVPGRKIRVVYQGVSDRFRQRLAEDALSQVLEQLGVRRPYLLFVGNPKPHKNLANVVRAYARARQLEEFDAELVAIGDRGGGDFKIHQLAEQLGVGRNVRLLGHVADEALPALYQGASLFVFPTLYEGFGLPVVEAMAAGVPVITSRNSALQEIGEGHAWLVDPLDVDELAHAIADCMRDPERRDELSQRGIRRAEEFRWDRTAADTLAIYREVLGVAAAGPPASDEEAGR